MIRQPTPLWEILRWHHNALAGRKPPIHESEPQCGWFRRRLVRAGPWVPARIWLEQEVDEETGELVADEVLCCEVCGEPKDPYDQWTWLAGQPISEEEFNHLMAVRRWAGWNEVESEPLANPRKSIDHLKSQIPF